MILSSLGAEKLNLQIPEHRELQNVVTEMALASGSPMPRIFFSSIPRPTRSLPAPMKRTRRSASPAGLLTLLDREDTQGVIAHEMSHIRNEDILLMTLVSVLLGGIVLLSDWGRHGLYGSRSGRRLSRKSPLLFLPLLLLIAVSPIIASSWRWRCRANENIWRMRPQRNIRAIRAAWRAHLERIRDGAMPFSKASRGTAHLFIMDPLRRRLDEHSGALADLLATHPPIERRIALLYRMAGIARPEISGSKVRGSNVQGVR